MRKLDDAALRKAAILKKARAAVRAHYSTLADARLNELLPALELEFEKSVANGILPSADRLLITSGFRDDLD